MGIGIDVIQIERFSHIKSNKKLLNSIYTENEMNYLQKLNFEEKYLAQLFATKEAVSKALGTGFSKGISPKNIEITFVNNLPKVNLNAVAKTIFEEKKYKKIEISITNGINSIAVCKIN